MFEARYDNYRLVRVNLDTEEQLKIFQEIEAKSDSFIFYGHARKVNQKLTIMVASHKIAEYLDIIERFNVVNEVLVCKFTCTLISHSKVIIIIYWQEYNMQSKIDAEKLTIQPKTTAPQNFGWSNYFHLETINGWLEMLANTHEMVSVITIGNSYE